MRIVNQDATPDELRYLEFDGPAAEAYDPARHDWYKSGSRGYDSRYGSRADYRDDYRGGFVDGYDNTFRNTRDTRTGSDGVSIWDRINGRN